MLLREIGLHRLVGSDVAVKLVQAVVIKLDCCNSMQENLWKTALCHLQHVKHARLIFRLQTCNHNHITPNIIQLSSGIIGQFLGFVCNSF